jgi:hypothetical protein
MKLVSFVIDKSYSIGRAAKRLKIKLSTAKMIVKKFRDFGVFSEPRQQKLKQKVEKSKKIENNIEV